MDSATLCVYVLEKNDTEYNKGMDDSNRVQYKENNAHSSPNLVMFDNGANTGGWSMQQTSKLYYVVFVQSNQ